MANTRTCLRQHSLCAVLYKKNPFTLTLLENQYHEVVLFLVQAIYLFFFTYSYDFLISSLFLSLRLEEHGSVCEVANVFKKKEKKKKSHLLFQSFKLLSWSDRSRTCYKLVMNPTILFMKLHGKFIANPET